VDGAVILVHEVDLIHAQDRMALVCEFVLRRVYRLLRGKGLLAHFKSDILKLCFRSVIRCHWQTDLTLKV
jgi:hypothetical protein